MRAFAHLTLALLVALLPAEAQEVVGDSLVVDEHGISRRYWLEPIIVHGRRIDLGTTARLSSKTDTPRILDRSGFDLVRKGSDMASDLYAEGFKRGDIAVVIDGERYPSACPNRMDTPCSRVNPLQIDGVELSKSCASASSGLGGQVEFHREAPNPDRELRGAFSAGGGGTEFADFAIAADLAGSRLTGRVLTGSGHRDARGRGFVDLYGYRENRAHYLWELAVHRERNDWTQGASISSTQDVAFPYLRMDERQNDLVSAYLGWRGQKLYANRTHHFMDNGLRVRSAMMRMENDARNTTLGLSGDSYELFYRGWDVENTMAMTEGMTVRNRMIADLRLVSARLHREVELGHGFGLHGRIGAQIDHLGDAERIAFFHSLYPDADENRAFAIWGLGLSHVRELGGDWSAGLLAETISEPPDPAQLFIALQKMGDDPWWAGNPELSAPIRTTLRAQARSLSIVGEAFVTHVRNLPSLTKMSAEEREYQTYEENDALLMGANLRIVWPHLLLSTSYTHGRNLDRDRPLAEIAPVALSAELRPPEIHGLGSFFRCTLAGEQNRVDRSVGERPTPSWIRLDAGLKGEWRTIDFGFDVENLSQELYHQHLSYLRDPFATGSPVYEPGRTFRLRISAGS